VVWRRGLGFGGRFLPAGPAGVLLHRAGRGLHVRRLSQLQLRTGLQVPRLRLSDGRLRLPPRRRLLVRREMQVPRLHVLRQVRPLLLTG
jgi:hypothetical protein